MKKIVYGFAFATSFSVVCASYNAYYSHGAYSSEGAYNTYSPSYNHAPYCPDTLTSDQMDILAVEEMPYGDRKGLYGGVKFQDGKTLFTAASEADRRTIKEARFKYKTARKESETVQSNPKVVMCSYQCREGYWKFKLLAPIS